MALASSLPGAMRAWTCGLATAAASTGTEVVRRAPVERRAFAWSGHQLLYGTVVSGRPAILRVTPGQDTSEEVVLDALTPGVTSDGRTIVFVSSSTDSSSTCGRRKRTVAGLPDWCPRSRRRRWWSRPTIVR